MSNLSPPHSESSSSSSDNPKRQVLSPGALVLQKRWELIERLGQGGMGTVFLARDLRLSSRLCVVKKLRIEFLKNEDRQKALAFFKREAMVLSSLKHSNIVSIHDYFEENGEYYLVMEYVEGDNLQHMLARRGAPFSEREVVTWATTMCDVLNYLHSHYPPVIYRDLKPSNIMLNTTDGIKLVDFGIARSYTEDSENTHVVSGGYSPPEQYWGGADTRSDIYALGSTMYFLLTGKEPVALQTSIPKTSNRNISDHLDRIIQKATAQDIWLRYQAASEMHNALLNVPKQKLLAFPPAFILITCSAALVSVAAAGFIYFTVTKHNNPKQSSAISQQFSPEISKSRSTSNSQKENTILTDKPNTLTENQPQPLQQNHSTLSESPYSFDLAVPDTREEMITDPEGLKPLSEN